MDVFDFVESDEEEPVVKKLKRFEFPGFTCFDNRQIDLHLKEIKMLKHFTSLSRAWGYRSGKKDHHEKYELESEHQLLIPIQKYSDVLFRSLWAIEKKSNIYFESDILDKLYTCDDLTNQDLISEFVAKFVKEEFDLLYDLAHISITSKNSGIFTTIVIAAQSLMLIATKRNKEAYQLFQNVADCFL
jgi:hypothetical protein